MATEIVQQWITRDMKLSKFVTSFEADFSNGYLFGEILNRYGLIEDISTFSKKTGKDSKVNNFQQVEKAMRDLKVKFDGKLIHQIMNEERGASLRLLYQIKLGIEKADIGGVDANKKTMSNIKPDILNRKLEETLNLKTTLPQTFSLNGSKKLAPIEKAMLPFEHRKMLLEKKAFDDQRKEEELIMSLYMETRDQSKRKMEENKEFMNDWLKEGKKNWHANQQKRGDAIARVQYFEDKEVKAYKGKLGRELDIATRELIGGVDEFEKNLQKLGIEKNTNIEEAMKRMDEKKGVPPGQIQNFSYAATMNKIKEKKNLLDFAVKERDRRRRKMIVDQSKTQSMLDRNKQEELMIEKLLKQQDDEQKLAYLEKRETNCKQIIVDSRRNKALQNEEKRRNQIEELERQRSETMPVQIQKHMSEIADRKQDFSKLRRDEKAKKRSLNVEICSEVIDLILDLGNEAFDETQKNPNGKIDKPVWREWMRLFKDNKLISKARKGLLNQPEESSFLVTDNSKQEGTLYDILEDAKQPIDRVIDVVKNEQCYSDMLEYLSTSGIFNLTEGNQEWTQFPLNIASTLKKLDINSQIFKHKHSPSNPDIGAMISQFMNSDVKEEKKEDLAIGLPHYLTLKLCLLGRSCAGKRTISKQIQDLYPAGKIKVFRMDELIREVLEYINPKPVTDAAALDKGKKAPPAKGKVEETQPTDAYAGLDTKDYKEIGNQLKKFLGEGELPAGQDLTALIPDDNLLVNLFAQKLRLTFPSEKSNEAKIEEIKQNLAREDKLLEELAELEAANAAGGDPSKAGAKGGKAPPAKKGAVGGPSGEEQLRAELDLITKVQPEGWILLDFPRTLKQAKTMEQVMTGFVSNVDDTNFKPQRDFEQWSKIATPATFLAKGEEVSFNGEPFVYKSTTDGYLFLDVASEECQRRVTGRKIDPTTNIIYHMEDSPPPEGDAKLKDRLLDYVGEPETDHTKLSQNHQLYGMQQAGLKKWASSFALREDGIDGVNVLMEVAVEDRLRKEEVLEKVQKQIGKVLAFKQALFDDKKNKVKLSLQAATSENLGGTVSQQKLDEGANQETEGDEGKALSRNDALEAGQNVQSKPSIHTRSAETIHEHKKSISSKFEDALGDPQGKRAFFKSFENDYYRSCLTVFKAVRRQRESVFEGLTQMQQHFIEQYLSRVDARQGMLVQDFIDSFNKFSEEFPNLRNDSLTQEELRKRVTRLSNDMWSLLETKKNQALAQHAKLNSDGWVVNEMKKLMKYACRIVQSELQRFSVLVSLVSQEAIILDIDLEQTLDNYSDDGLKTVEDNGSSPLFDNVLTYALNVVQRQKDRASLDESQQVLIAPELETVLYRMNLIRTWVLKKVKEFNVFWRQLYEVLDDGIVVAIRLENEATQSVIGRIHDHMDDQQNSGFFTPMDYSDFRIPYIDLDSEIERIDFSSSDQQVVEPEFKESDEVVDVRFKLGMLESLYDSLRYYAYEEYLDVQTFINQIVLSLQQDLLPQYWRKQDFSVFYRMAKELQLPIPEDGAQSYSSKNEIREFFNWKKLFTMFTLVGAPLPNQEELDVYQTELISRANEEGILNLEAFKQVPAWFDEFESVQQEPRHSVPSDEDEDDDHAQRDEQRLLDIKCRLFKVHQTNIKVLRVSDLIGVFTELSQLVDANSYSNYHGYLFRTNQDQ